MRKFKAVVLVLSLLILASPSYASVGISDNGTLVCTATDIAFQDIGGTMNCNGSAATFQLMLAGAGTSGATSMTTSQFDVLPGYSFIRKDISADAAFNNGRLANGTPGQLLTLYIVAVQGSGTFILTPTTKTGFTTLTFNAVGDQVTLLYVDDTSGWVIVSSTSVTVAQP